MYHFQPPPQQVQPMNAFRTQTPPQAPLVDPHANVDLPQQGWYPNVATQNAPWSNVSPFAQVDPYTQASIQNPYAFAAHAPHWPQQANVAAPFAQQDAYNVLPFGNIARFAPAIGAPFADPRTSFSPYAAQSASPFAPAQNVPLANPFATPPYAPVSPYAQVPNAPFQATPLSPYAQTNPFHSPLSYMQTPFAATADPVGIPPVQVVHGIPTADPLRTQMELERVRQLAQFDPYRAQAEFQRIAQEESIDAMECEKIRQVARIDPALAFAATLQRVERIAVRDAVRARRELQTAIEAPIAKDPRITQDPRVAQQIQRVQHIERLAPIAQQGLQAASRFQEPGLLQQNVLQQQQPGLHVSPFISATPAPGPISAPFANPLASLLR